MPMAGLGFLGCIRASALETRVIIFILHELMRTRWKYICLAALTIFTWQALGNDLPIGRFGKADCGDWKVVGTAFQQGPASGADELRRLEIENADGDIVASSEKEIGRQDDRPQGTLTSPEFKVTRKFISFRIGGGDHEHHTCINLLVDGRVVRSATGSRSDRMFPASWDVSQWRGRKAQVQLVDVAGGEWGHINVSRVVQTDTPERLPVETGPLYQEALRPQFHFTARQWTMSRLTPACNKKAGLMI